MLPVHVVGSTREARDTAMYVRVYLHIHPLRSRCTYCKGNIQGGASLRVHGETDLLLSKACWTEFPRVVDAGPQVTSLHIHAFSRTRVDALYMPTVYAAVGLEALSVTGIRRLSAA